jgi:Pyridoxamine 5'-phosphate oxidase
MGQTYTEIDDQMRAFVARQHVFFVATAPTGADGHVNCSPKGLESLRILGPKTIAYLDLVGSGAETIAHLRQNGRIVIMLCAFEGPPKILRFYGRGQVVEPGDADFQTLMASFAPRLGLRAIIRVELDRISDSCGYGVPLMGYEGGRTQLPAWAERKGEDGLQEYRRQKNAVSIDGLPALRSAGDLRKSRTSE